MSHTIIIKKKTIRFVGFANFLLIFNQISSAIYMYIVKKGDFHIQEKCKKKD